MTRHADTMHAMVLREPGQPLVGLELEVPAPTDDQVLVRVDACAVCRTDLHVFDGDLKHPKLPLVLGHEVVGTVAALGADAEGVAVGDRVGIPWLGHTCGRCPFCRLGRENLCDHPKFTGYTIDGGFAEYTVADPRYCFRIPERFSSLTAAPLLCAGLIGYRSYRMAGDAPRLGVYGFGAAAHIITQIAVHQGRRVFAFTRPGDDAGQAFATRLGCEWAGPSDVAPPDVLDSAIIFAPVGALVPRALRAVRKGGVVVCAGIHMSDIPQFPYAALWGERVVRSVANLTRQDGVDFMNVIRDVPLAPEIQSYPLRDANRALDHLRRGRVQGAAVLQIGHGDRS